MAELKTPTSIEFEYVVEIMYNNNPLTTSSYHYESFEKAKAHYDKVAEGTTNFVLFSLNTYVKREGAEDFKRLVLAKTNGTGATEGSKGIVLAKASGTATEVQKEWINETR